MKKIAYIVIIAIVLVFVFSIHKVVSKNDKVEESDKILSEIKQIENKIQNLFNQLNNISFENYKISSTEIKKEDSENSKESGNSKESEKSSSSKKSNETSSEETEENKEYKLEENRILTKSEEIDWNQIKNDVENINVLLHPLILDLYQTQANKDDINNFNNEYDNLIKAAKSENKEDTLKELSILYDYLSKFVENCNNHEKEKAVIKTKNNIFKAYSKLDKEEWEEIMQDVNNAMVEFSKISDNNYNTYNINKENLMINELKNAVQLKDKEVFLIKYKNLLEELQNM